jgi:hypothetical protein
VGCGKRLTDERKLSLPSVTTAGNGRAASVAAASTAICVGPVCRGATNREEEDERRHGRQQGQGGERPPDLDRCVREHSGNRDDGRRHQLQVGSRFAIPGRRA